MQFFRRSALSLTAVTFAFAVISWASPIEAQAQGPWHPRSVYSGSAYRSPYSSRFSLSFGYAPRYSGPIYHAPSVHTDYVYHPEYYHWTPGRGLHTHGHYDAVPHFTPGHFDYLHRGHVHGHPHHHH